MLLSLIFSWIFKSLIRDLNKIEIVVVCIGSEESSSSPVVRTGGGAKGGGRGVGGGGGATRKRKYAPNEQGRYVCAQCSRSYAAYHVKDTTIAVISRFLTYY